MSLLGEHVLMRVYLDSADRAPHTPTYERVIKLARREGLAGVTVLRGILGLGAGGEVRRHKAWSVVEHVPVIVEIVDDAGKIVALLERAVDELMIDGMVTLERANVMMYRGRDAEARGAAGAAAPLRL